MMRSVKVSEKVDIEIEQWKLFFLQRKKKTTKSAIIEFAMQELRKKLKEGKKDESNT